MQNNLKKLNTQKVYEKNSIPNHLNRIFPLKIKNRNLDLKSKTLVMGILNLTPDSFYDGGKYTTLDKSLKKIEKMIEDGADIIDIGAESTRPGSISVSADEELKRLMPVVEKAIVKFDVILSVDTTKALVAKEVLSAGVPLINDISGLTFEPEIAKHVASHKASIVLMHIPSRPHDMQKHTNYGSLIGDISEYLLKSIDFALENGIEFENIIIDPGIGFGKTTEQNLKILNNLGQFLELKRPILIGTSRKSFVGKVLNDIPVDRRLEGTAATVAIAIANGASIIRVHDILEMKNVAMVTNAICGAN